jgi:hypothetical protein
LKGRGNGQSDLNLNLNLERWAGVFENGSLKGFGDRTVVGEICGSRLWGSDRTVVGMGNRWIR